ncbi:MAG: T9SS type A sorting domain-containing protein, partial [Crocinitomicaceae bacterium]|nr:T9SS type A sorting domain-containing protein [Crocinitomicaceae bacterium]
GVPVITAVIITDPTCSGLNGIIDITATGGTGALQYSIDNGVTFQAGFNFTGLGAATYDVVVEDANGCQATSAVTLVDASGATLVNVAVVDPTCGNLTGQINITATGGTGTLQYSIDGGGTFQASNVFNGLDDAIYAIVVEDANGCQTSSSITLTDPGAPTITVASTTNPSCNLTNGVITITAAGGSGTLQYSIDGGVTFQASNTFTGLAGATYNIVVEDPTGCSAVTTVVLVDAGSPTLTIQTVSDPSCDNDNGTIMLGATGGAGGYQYSVDGGVTWTFSTNFIGLTPGTYNLMVQDANGCTDNGSAILTQAGSPTVQIDNVTDLLCYGTSTGGVDINVTGGTGPYTFDWSNDGTGDFDDPEDLVGGVPGVVAITVLDANGCAVLATTTINGPPELWATGTGNDESFGNDGSINFDVGGGTLPYSYNWSNGSTQEDPTGLVGNTTYTVIVTDANGCTTTIDVFVGSVVYLPEIENPMGIEISPNPTSAEIGLTYTSYSGETRVDIVDMAGRLVYHIDRSITQGEIITIDLGAVEAGIYFVNVSSETDMYSTRVVKR